MVKVFLLMAEGLESCYYKPNVTTGDGLLMGLWAGGVMQKSPHSSNIHYDPGINAGTSIPFLRVNQDGKRFSNEDVAYEQYSPARPWRSWRRPLMSPSRHSRKR